ncbi:biopolymer transporter ExbD [Mucilaginibacter sp. BT774]|uniref:ExbD/TolR family protein n=1 Tax=Mucilaginibacter sp. BT774 TaxID=3062276 RepID=UPI0026774E72|nr:biopolymer transporter ExbD [Mucilaginibacter sp. BT774]MDO3629022.1 biopolymer transporter ExbD [Mucilaginibacter sp. BT774]
MARIKIPRKSTAIDMTAMCDVAFLLLTFFILTAKLKQEDPLRVDVPGASVKVNVPDVDMATITVGHGKVFFGLEGTDLRKSLLEEMGKKYTQNFTPEEIQKFSLIPTFGVPVNTLKQYLALSTEDKKKYTQPGIPTDTTTNSELFNWIYEARIVTKNLHNKELRFAIKGDSHENYPEIGKIIDVLQKQAVNKFSLITALNQGK